MDLGWHSGRRRRKYVRGVTKTEVVRETRRLAQEAQAGRVKLERPPSVSEWMEKYLFEVAANRSRSSTKINWLVCSREASDASRPAPTGDGRRGAVAADQCQSCAGCRPPSIETEEVQPWSLVEAQTFLRAVRGDRLEARWMLTVMLGLRQGEALGLAWEDVDLSNATVRVRQALQYRPGEGLQLVAPKTNRSRRTVPLAQIVIDALARRREEQDQDRAEAGELWEGWSLVFTTKIWTPFAPCNDYRKFLTVFEAAELRRVRLHDLRYTAASLMLAQGVPARVGHGDPRSFADQHHPQHLQPCRARAVP